MPTAPSPRKLAKPKTYAPAPAKKTNQPQDKNQKNAPDSPESKAKELSTAFEKKIGLSPETLQKLFTAAKPTKDADKDPIVKLKALLRSRNLDARTFSLRNWRVHAAVDEAYNAAFRQITPTLIGKITSGERNLKTIKEVEEELARWGLPESSLLTPVKNPDGTVREKLIIKETFTNVKVPLVKAYVTAREARLFAERDNEPFMSFELTRNTEEWQVVGEIITKLVGNMSAGFDYKAVYRGVNHQVQKYSNCIMFPQEVWYTEEDDEGKTIKEGIRYNFPPPTRTAWDQTYRPGTLNSDTGCEWACYWRLGKYSDVDLNPAYYNKDKISYSATDWIGTSSAYRTYFEWVYPCSFPLPVMPSGGSGMGREENASLYTSADADKAIFLTDMFMKLSPAQWGLSDYKPKVWFRFVLASDGEIAYAEPYPYTPPVYLGSDADDSVSNTTASFALEVIPWMDLVGNVLSDILNAMKQNNIKVILYDKYQITEDKIQEMMARAKESGSAVWFPMDWKDLMRGQVNTDMLFKAFSFPLQNIGEKIATLNTVFNVMERGLGMSAQEVGAIAGHIQTAEEQKNIAGNQNSRLGLQISMGDDFFDAWKRQIVVAMKWFMDEDFAVDVSAVDEKVIEKMKKEFGFKFESVGKDKMRVTGKKSKLSVDAFLSTREGRTRQSNPQVAQVMFQGLAAIAANQDLAMRIGPEKIVHMYNRALALAGMPEDEKFKLDPEATSMVENKKLLEAIEKLSKQMINAAKQEGGKVAGEVTQEAGAQIAKEVAPAIQQVGEAAAEAGQSAQQAQQGVEQVAQQGQESDLQIVEELKNQKAQFEELAKMVLRIDQFIKMASGQQPPPPLQQAA